jgi:hypothetical protein
MPIRQERIGSMVRRRAVKRWRTSTWVYLLLVVAAITAEVIYAVGDDANLQAMRSHA